MMNPANCSSECTATVRSGVPLPIEQQGGETNMTHTPQEWESMISEKESSLAAAAEDASYQARYDAIGASNFMFSETNGIGVALKRIMELLKNFLTGLFKA